MGRGRNFRLRERNDKLRGGRESLHSMLYIALVQENIPS